MNSPRRRYASGTAPDPRRSDTAVTRGARLHAKDRPRGGRSGAGSRSSRSLRRGSERIAHEVYFYLIVFSWRKVKKYFRNGAQVGRPDKAALREIAAAQDGYFSLAQAHEAGYSSQLVRYHCKVGTFLRVRRGIYRLADFPEGERPDLTISWLWSEQLGVFSHGTALSLHRLSDLLPERIHMTLPPSERGRTRSRPPGLVLHYAELSKSEQGWHGSVPVTSPARTLQDCVASGLTPLLLRQALEEAVERGLLDVSSITSIAASIDALERG
ncbi:MAG: type IV toxin-antitoxin system AbiEi family antitoxin domain-containing protein [Myxococcales bacterium]|nr:type IV toxin-antitoxin system AbiEi family antitoxin domain-containing protein [Myxococcales bacterium]